MITRRNTHPVCIGGVWMGGDHPIRIQSMNNTDTRQVQATLDQIQALAQAGCELTRVAVLNREAAQALRQICAASPLPVVADIHFDYRLALLSIEAGAAKIRINPGNIGDESRLRAVAQAAREAHVPIRVGVNAGSLEKDLLAKYEGQVTAAALAESALRAVRQMEAVGVQDLVVSLKASDPLLTIEAYRLLAPQIPYALHLGVTEAGTVREGLIRSAVGIGTLLAEGIGDTLRVSLTADPVEEVQAGWAILKSLQLRRRGPVFVSCPTCGRTQVNLVHLAQAVEARLATLPWPLQIAVMGCAVNGPGEARHADYGLAGGHGRYLLFCKGEIIDTVDESKALEALVDRIKQDYGDWEQPQGGRQCPSL